MKFIFNYHRIHEKIRVDGIVLSLPFAPPSMASLTADFFLIYIHVSEKNKAAQGRYHPPGIVLIWVRRQVTLAFHPKIMRGLQDQPNNQLIER